VTVAGTRERVTFHKKRERLPVPGRAGLTYAQWEARDADNHQLVAEYDADRPETSHVFDELWPSHGYLAWREAVREAAGPIGGPELWL
jgi:hypothetical protein